MSSNIGEKADMPLFSICMCNYNMAHTIRQSLESILSQIDEDFEVILVDDGSSDASRSIIEEIQTKYVNLRVIFLERDNKRKLGMTRNISIQEARGKYVILHIDCDDIYKNYIKDFTQVFCELRKRIGRSFLLAGQHVYMAEKDWLLEFGPYQNIYRGEDRDLLERAAAKDALIIMNHKKIHTALRHPIKKRYLKILWDTFDHIVNEFCIGKGFREVFMGHFSKLFSIKTCKYSLLVLCLVFPAWGFAQIQAPLPNMGNKLPREDYFKYYAYHFGTLPELLERFTQEHSTDFLRPEAREIFLNVEAN